MTRPDAPANQSNVLRLHMDGVEELDGNVRLATFIDKLDALKAALAEVGHQQTKDGKATVEFVVTELSHNSPAMIGVEAVVIEDQNAILSDPNAVINGFAAFLGQVKQGTVQAVSNHAKLVGALRKLVAGHGEKFSRLWIDGPAIDTIPLDSSIADALDDALPDVRREFGAIKGVVKRYNGVGKQPYFKIVPPVGGVEIKCNFPQQLLAEAAAAVEHNVTIEGGLKYYEGDLWPHEVHVREIVIHPHDDHLPRLANLYNQAPSATGELSAAEFVRELRNEW